MTYAEIFLKLVNIMILVTQTHQNAVVSLERTSLRSTDFLVVGTTSHTRVLLLSGLNEEQGVDNEAMLVWRGETIRCPQSNHADCCNTTRAGEGLRGVVAALAEEAGTTVTEQQIVSTPTAAAADTSGGKQHTTWPPVPPAPHVTSRRLGTAVTAQQTFVAAPSSDVLIAVVLIAVATEDGYVSVYYLCEVMGQEHYLDQTQQHSVVANMTSDSAAVSFTTTPPVETPIYCAKL